jgi:hypothetical protein
MSVAEQEIVQKLAAAMRELPDRQINPEPEHLFAPGMYVRVLHMPAGSVIVSKIHKTEHFCLAVNGRALVRVGEGIEEVVGPKLMRTLPGTQRALCILEDATWITFHPTEETNLEAIEEQIIAKSHDDPVLLAYRNLLGEVA